MTAFKQFWSWVTDHHQERQQLEERSRLTRVEHRCEIERTRELRRVLALLDAEIENLRNEREYDS